MHINFDFKTTYTKITEEIVNADIFEQVCR